MKIFALSDLHLSFQCDKPMNVFGENWVDYEKRILDDWNSKVGDSDIGIIAGDISWAMRASEIQKDFEFLGKLNGTKIIIRGNHDYWWSTITKVRDLVPENTYALQNDSIKFGEYIFCGTRGWKVPERYQKQSAEDKKIFDREVLRFEMSLKDAVNKMPKSGGQSDDEVREKQGIIAILHYPPFNSMRDDSPFTALCEKYGVKTCIYGHLHGKQGRSELLTVKNGIKYYLTSCDLVGFKMVEIDV